ncbi:MAG: hypothetical protein J7K66_06810 [Anaerolineaceae bacterium]|nr:hypothetical protein [Anaerolineaceae bacterium]
MQPLIDLLTDKIDITHVPFSDRGSRLLVYQDINKDCLYIRLAERLGDYFSGIESFLTRNPYIPELAFVNGMGEKLPFEIITKPHVLEFQTDIGKYKLIFQDVHTLCFSLPTCTECGVRLKINAETCIKRTDGGEIYSVRNLTYSSQSKIIKNKITSNENGSELEFIIKTDENSLMTLCIGNTCKSPLTTESFPEMYHAAKLRWEAWFNRSPSVKEPYWETYAYAWWVLANNMICPKGNIKFEMDVPSKKSYAGIWLWDSALHVIALRHIDPELARDQIRGVLVNQQQDGMLPDAVFDDDIVTEIDHPVHGKVTKPPILAWAALKIHEIDSKYDFLNEIYQPLVKWNAWWFKENDDNRDGIVQYNHPYSSGLDDSPLWDYGMPVESPDINTYLFIQMKSLASIAEILNKTSDASYWSERAKKLLTRMIDFFWDEKTGSFLYFYKNKPIRVLTPFNLYPLWTGELPENIKGRIIEHLRSPNEFYGDYMLPSVARTDTTYNSDKMWRGPVWININYFFIEALQQIGEFDLAKTIREKTLKLIMSNTGIYEYYNSKTGKPGKNAAPIFSWTAALFIDLSIQASREIDDQQTMKKEEIINE